MYTIGEINKDFLECMREKDNIKIKYYGNSKKCYIFFSSHAIYYPNTKEIFNEVIVKQDRYEWEKLASPKEIVENSRMHIFVRDIYKQWYVEGINKQINSIKRLLSYLKEITKDYEVITVGNSAGGYMAVIAAEYLKATYCFNFAGQISLLDEIGHNYLLAAACDDTSKSCYFNIGNLYRSIGCKVYYFYAKKNAEDCKSYGLIEKYENVIGFGFRQKIHGISMFSDNMIPILCSTEEEMDKLSKIYKNRMINRWEFLLRTTSFKTMLYVVWKRVRKILLSGRNQV